jgi:hypothetical protein
MLDKMLEAFGAEALQRIARQSDGAAQDMRVIGGMIGSALLTSDDPAKFATLNAGVRVPTTLPQTNPGT